MTVWAAIGLAFTLCVGAGVAKSAPARCPNANVVVDAVDREDFATGCRAAATAAEFLVGSGLQTAILIEISFVDVMPDVVVATPAVGCYVRAEERIYVLTFARCHRKLLSHDVVIDRSVHTGLVVHEVAHRIVAANVGQIRLSTVANEYIAYVTMYATMPEARRHEVLKQIPGDGFTSELQINMTMYLLDPVYFGAQAYRHYLKPGIGRSFLASVLNGQVLIEDEPR